MTADFFKTAALALGIGTVGVAGGYMYKDTADKTDEYSRVGVENYIDADISKVDTWFLHHTAGGDLSQAALYHTVSKEFGGHEWDGIAYSYGWEDNGSKGDYYLVNTRPIDTKGNQAAKNNTRSRGAVVAGNFDELEPTEDLLLEIETWLYATLKLYPKVTSFQPHNKNPHSNTACPGSKLEKAVKKRGLFFTSRSEIQWFIKRQENRLRNPCNDNRKFEDSEPC